MLFLTKSRVLLFAKSRRFLHRRRSWCLLVYAARTGENCVGSVFFIGLVKKALVRGGQGGRSLPCVFLFAEHAGEGSQRGGISCGLWEKRSKIPCGHSGRPMQGDLSIRDYKAPEAILGQIWGIVPTSLFHQLWQLRTFWHRHSVMNETLIWFIALKDWILFRSMSDSHA